MNGEKYTLLAEVSLLHSYFEKGLLKGVKVVPDKITQIFMLNAGLLLRTTEAGFAIYKKNSFDAEYLKELTEFFKDHLLRFHLFYGLTDFINYTDAPLGKLVTFKYSNRAVKDADSAEILLPKITQQLLSKSPLAQVDLYLSSFLEKDSIVAKNYLIMFSARNTRWKYYMMNIGEMDADKFLVQSPEGEFFEGPVKRELQNGQAAYEFHSGTQAFPFQEKPTSFCSLKRKSDAQVNESSDENETVMEVLPAPSPQSITSVEKDEQGTVACSSIYIYL